MNCHHGVTAFLGSPSCNPLCFDQRPIRQLHTTLRSVPINSSYYFYRVSLSANAAFLTLFCISFLGFSLGYAFTRRATAFTVAMAHSVALEIVGYVGRVLSSHNQWQQPGFIIQVVCFTIAPAFLAAGIHLCVWRIVYAFGPENSRIKPETYTRLVRPPSL